MYYFSKLFNITISHSFRESEWYMSWLPRPKLENINCFESNSVALYLLHSIPAKKSQNYAHQLSSVVCIGGG